MNYKQLRSDLCQNIANILTEVDTDKFFRVAILPASHLGSSQTQHCHFQVSGAILALYTR